MSGHVYSSAQSVSIAPHPVPANLHQIVRDVVISHVQSADEIYMQLSSNTEIMSDLQQRLFDQYNNVPPPSHSMPPVWHIGDIVVALYSLDQAWYRARVLSLGQGAHVRVHFVDYGNDETVHNSQVRAISHELASVSHALCLRVALRGLAQPPAQHKAQYEMVLQDVMNTLLTDPNTAAWSMLVTEHRPTNHGTLLVGELMCQMQGESKQRQVNEQFKAQLQAKGLCPPTNVAAPVTVAPVMPQQPLHMNMQTNVPFHINTTNPVTAMHPTQMPMQPMFPTGVAPTRAHSRTNVSAAMPYAYEEVSPNKLVGQAAHGTKLTAVVSPGELYVQLCDEKRADKQQTLKLHLLSNHMNKMYGDVTQHVLTTMPVRNQPVAARFVDNNWYRGEFLGMVPFPEHPERGMLPSVRFVDYGNVETMTMDKLRVLPVDLARYMCPLAIRVHLVDVHKPMAADWPEAAGLLLEEYLEQDCLVEFRSCNTDQGKVTYTADVAVLDKDTNQMKSLTQILNQKGLCAAQQLASNMSMPMGMSAMGQAQPQALRTPSSLQSPLSVSNIRPLATSYSPHHPVAPSTAIRFPELVGLVGTVCDRVAVLECVSCDEFIVQLSAHQQQFAQVQTATSTYQPPAHRPALPAHLLPGTALMALFADDRCWYRAEVIEEKAGGQISVVFVDFGNTSKCSRQDVAMWFGNANTYKVLTETPKLAITCCLAGVQSIPSKWDAQANNQFLELMQSVSAANAVQVVSYDAASRRHSLNVQLHTTLSLAQALLTQHLVVSVNTAQGDTAVPHSITPASASANHNTTVRCGQYSVFELPDCDYVDVRLLYTPDSADSGVLFVRVDSNELVVDSAQQLNIMFTAANYSPDGRVPESINVLINPAIGSSAAVFYAEIGWCRAMVTGRSVTHQQVCLVDHALIVDIPSKQLYKLDELLMALPWNVLPVRLHNLNGTIVPDQHKQLTKHPLVMRTHGQDAKGVFVVTLVLDEGQEFAVSVTDMITGRTRVPPLNTTNHNQHSQSQPAQHTQHQPAASTFNNQRVAGSFSAESTSNAAAGPVRSSGFGFGAATHNQQNNNQDRNQAAAFNAHNNSGGGGGFGQKASTSNACHNCGVPGHFKHSCPQPAKDNRPSTSYGQSVCYNCNKTGHFSRECPEERQPRGPRAPHSSIAGGFGGNGTGFGGSNPGGGGGASGTKQLEDQW